MAYNPDVPSFDNYAVEDLNKMRENFQILANIATRREDILSLAVEAGDILDSRIVEHNLNILSPTNGYYVRWENGLQVCYIGPVDTVFGNNSNLQYSWTYPAAFASTPRVYATGYYQAFSEKFRSTAHFVYSRNVSSTTAYIGFGSSGAWADGDQSLGEKIMGYAIGRWK